MCQALSQEVTWQGGVRTMPGRGLGLPGGRGPCQVSPSACLTALSRVSPTPQSSSPSCLHDSWDRKQWAWGSTSKGSPSRVGEHCEESRDLDTRRDSRTLTPMLPLRDE